ACLQDLRGVLGLVHDIIRIGPQAKLCIACGLFRAKHGAHATGVADAGRNLRDAGAHEVRLQPALGPAVTDEDVGNQPAIAVALGRRRFNTIGVPSASATSVGFATITPASRTMRPSSSAIPSSVVARTVALPMFTKRQPSCARAESCAISGMNAQQSVATDAL